jgi:SAM-dependent methyltransferase
VRLANRVFEHTLAYRLLQAPWAEAKLAPLYRHGDVRAFRRVLDIGCGPGTNTAHFAHCDYLGLDLNPRYIESARRRHGRDFVVADATRWQPEPGERADCVLVNSLLHHLDDASAAAFLEGLRPAIADGGRVHLFDLVLPERRGVARALARLDRGAWARSVPRWRELFSAEYDIVANEEYPLRVGPLVLWNMIYLKGRVRA